MSRRNPSERPGAIGRKIDKAMFEVLYGSLEEALLQACIAVDATASRLFPGKGTAARNIEFLHEDIQLIFLVATARQFRVEKPSIRLGIVHPDLKGTPGKVASLEEIIYHVLRCSLVHEGELPSEISLTSRNQVGWRFEVNKNGKPSVLPWQIILGLVLAVVGASVNASERTKNSYVIDRIELNKYWGQRDRILKVLRRPCENKGSPGLESGKTGISP